MAKSQTENVVLVMQIIVNVLIYETRNILLTC